MTAPTAPYCGTDDVAVLIPQFIQNAADFSASTQPTQTVVQKFITWKSAEIDRAFAAVGYYVPFQDISASDTWPDGQTYLLELMVSFGVAGLIVGPVAKPAPAMGRDSGRSHNAFTQSFVDFLASVKENGAGFRALYRVGSKAEKFCREPRGPLTDYLQGYLDPTLFMLVGEYTEVIDRLRSDYNITGRSAWDHLQVKRSALLG